MLHILSNYGIPDKIVQAIAVMYHAPTRFVSTPDGPTEPFVTTTGILQVDTLTPYLFVIVVDYILQLSTDGMNKLGLDAKPSKTNRDPTKFLTDLDYADDIALTPSTLKDAQQLLVSLEVASAKVSSLLNARKTEYLTVNGDVDAPPVKSKDGTVLNSVEDFKYLGSCVVDSRKDFVTCKAQAWSACNRLHHVWTPSPTWAPPCQACLCLMLRSASGSTEQLLSWRNTTSECGAMTC